MTPWDRSLPTWIETAYETLVPYLQPDDRSITADEAVSILLEEADDVVFEEADAEHAVQTLLNRGYFYEVDGELRVTDPQSVESTSESATDT